MTQKFSKVHSVMSVILLSPVTVLSSDILKFTIRNMVNLNVNIAINPSKN